MGFYATRVSAPDERPLLPIGVATGLKLPKTGVQPLRNRELFRREDPILPILFCLFAAEAWRRHHEAGPWKWQTVLREVDAAGIEHSTLVGWVERGLRYWRRKLIVNSSGREFLLTIACEGGLPLNLLRREGSGLRRYFRALLEELPRYDKVSVELGRELAERLRDRLPSGLRQEVVYQLSGKLITTIWDLQAQVVGNSDPIGALNRLKLDWRDDLPLSLGDTVTEVLLRLVEDAADWSPTATCSLAARTGSTVAGTPRRLARIARRTACRLDRAWAGSDAQPFSPVARGTRRVGTDRADHSYSWRWRWRDLSNRTIGTGAVFPGSHRHGGATPAIDRATSLFMRFYGSGRGPKSYRHPPTL